jgi:hypothetical protein
MVCMRRGSVLSCKQLSCYALLEVVSCYRGARQRPVLITTNTTNIVSRIDIAVGLHKAIF